MSKQTVWFQGEPGAFSEAALLTLFPGAQAVGLETFSAVFDALASGPEGVALLPIENAYAGTVYDVLDGLMASPDLTVYCEITHRVALALMGPQSMTLSDVVRVRSHPQALMQTRGYWSRQGWRMEVGTDTAGSAREVAEKEWPGVAAIAAPGAAARYGLKILEDGIEDHPDNRTRFWLVTHREREVDWWRAIANPRIDAAGIKASLVFETANEPGSLLHALQPFADRKINLSKIESRPRAKSAFSSWFWIDCQSDLDLDVLEEFGRATESYRVLGRYPVVRVAG